jgi:quercetin dioxygenase-like cupin family protein
MEEVIVKSRVLTGRGGKVVATIALVAAALGTGMAQASPPAGLTATTHADGSFVESYSFSAKDTKRVVTQTLTIEPGGETGWHVHPGIVFLTVGKGTIKRYNADRTVEVFPAGTSFIKQGNLALNGVNEGTVPVELHLTYVIPEGAPLRYERPAPDWWSERTAG